MNSLIDLIYCHVHRLASRIDSSIEAANHEVSLLRAELTDTSHKLNQMMPTTSIEMAAAQAG